MAILLTSKILLWRCNQKKCIFYNKRESDNYLSTNEIDNYKKRRKNVRQKAQRLLSKNPDKHIELFNEVNYNMGGRVYIEGVTKNGRGGIIVEPCDFVNILESGFMITDNIVNSYMNLLVHSEKYDLSIVSSFFFYIF